MNSFEISQKAYLVVAFARPKLTSELIDFLISKDLKIYLFVDRAQTKFTPNEQMISSAQKYFGHRNVNIRIATEANGSQRGVEAALDWIFQKEELVVVLEDDSIVTNESISYFDSAAGILSDKIAIVSSRRILDETSNGECSMHSHISRFALTNGWMTSRDFWIHNYHRKNSLLRFMRIRIDSVGFLLSLATKFFFFIGTCRYERRIGNVGWDQKVIYSLLRDNLYSFVPNRSTVGNRGMDEFASNTRPLNSQDTILYGADSLEPNFEVSHRISCQKVLNEAFLGLYGISRKNLLSPIKYLYEIVLGNLISRQ
jgi:hypothetical protein